LIEIDMLDAFWFEKKMIYEKYIVSLTCGYHEEKYVFDETLFYTGFFNFFSCKPQTHQINQQIHEEMPKLKFFEVSDRTSVSTTQHSPTHNNV
jgi:hypothetical protein